MPVYRYRYDLIPQVTQEEIAEEVDGAVSTTAYPKIYQDVTAPAASKPDLDDFMIASGFVFIEKDPHGPPDDDCCCHKHEHEFDSVELSAIGGSLSGSLPVGPPLPLGAAVLGAEVVVLTALAGPGLVGGTCDVGCKPAGDKPGSIILGAETTIPGPTGYNGTNRYASRGGQQIEATFTNAGAGFATLTAGRVRVTLFYEVPE